MRRTVNSTSLLGRGSDGSAASIGRTSTVVGHVPLTTAQCRLWYMSQLDPSSPYYNVTLAVRLKFAVNVQALRAALHTLVERHEILRTRYTVESGVPTQEILSETDFVLKTLVNRSTKPGTRDTAISRFTRRIARTRLRLDDRPPFEAALLSLSSRDHLLVILTHHIATDQQSINLMSAELERLYDAHASNNSKASCLAAKPTQYREFALWESDRLRRDDTDLISFWDRQLAGFDGCLPLPFDHKPKSDAPGPGAEYLFQITCDEAERVRAICRRHKTTEFMGLFSIWSCLLHRYTGKRRIVVATTTAFREDRLFRETLGCFINTLVIGVDLAPTCSFAQVLLNARENILACFENRSFSFERYVARRRTLGLSEEENLIQTYFQFQPRSLATTSRAAPRFTPNVQVHNGRAKFPLMLNVSDRGSHLDCAIEYDRRSFNRTTIAKMARDLGRLLNAFCLAPDQCIGDISLEFSRKRCAPSASEQLTKHQVLSPRSRDLTELEKKLAGIWRELLLVEPKQPEDDFMLLGGHSLLLTQLVWKIREIVGVSVRLRDIHKASRLEAMASLVESSPLHIRKPAKKPATEVTRIDGLACQVDLGLWSRSDLDQLIESLAIAPVTLGERVIRAAHALVGTPFQFESLRPLPIPGRVPVILSTFDCVTFVYTALALGLSQTFGDFVRTLRAIRYRDPEHAAPDSDPENGTIFDFVEESLFLNAVSRNLLYDVTAEVAGVAPIEDVELRLTPIRRDRSVDPHERWATPKLANRTIRMAFLTDDAFHRLEEPGVICEGDILVMSRGLHGRPTVVDHVGFTSIESDNIYLLQSTRHFAWRPDATPQTAGRYTSVFYDTFHRREQIGVGIGGQFVGNHAAFQRDGITYHGYESGTKRSLRDYLIGAGFTRVMVLRPSNCLPGAG